MRLDDPTNELAALVVEAGEASARTRDRTDVFLAGVLDGVQARREWAEDELAAIQQAGAQARFKRHWKPAPAPMPVGKIHVEVQTVVGVQRAGEWLQLPLSLVTPDELAHLVAERTVLRNRSTAELVILRRLLTFVDQHRGARTIGEALESQSVDLLDVMAGVAA